MKSKIPKKFQLKEKKRAAQRQKKKIWWVRNAVGMLQRGYYTARQRPGSHNPVWSQPFSVNHPHLADEDPQTAALLHKKDTICGKQESLRKRRLLSRRLERQRELRRRTAERETLANYLGQEAYESPFLRTGVPVYEQRIAELRDRFATAEALGAVDAIEALEHTMRQTNIRVRELFAKVDHDNSGCVDRNELRRALQEAGLRVPPEHLEALFRFLDTSGDGAIAADELELAVRTHRRFRWDQEQVRRDAVRTAEWSRTGVDYRAGRVTTRSARTAAAVVEAASTATGAGARYRIEQPPEDERQRGRQRSRRPETTSSSMRYMNFDGEDARISPSFKRLVVGGEVSNSLPLLGQFLMVNSVKNEGECMNHEGYCDHDSRSDNEHSASIRSVSIGGARGNASAPVRLQPQTVVAAQAAAAQAAAAREHSLRTAQLFEHRAERRRVLRRRLHERRDKRRTLERRTTSELQC